MNAMVGIGIFICTHGAPQHPADLLPRHAQQSPSTTGRRRTPPCPAPSARRKLNSADSRRSSSRPAGEAVPWHADDCIVQRRTSESGSSSRTTPIRTRSGPGPRPSPASPSCRTMPVTISRTDIKMNGVHASVTLPKVSGFVSWSDRGGAAPSSAAASAACGSALAGATRRRCRRRHRLVEVPFLFRLPELQEDRRRDQREDAAADVGHRVQHQCPAIIVNRREDELKDRERAARRPAAPARPRTSASTSTCT